MAHGNATNKALIDIKMNTTNIILCGGPLNYSNLPIGISQSNAMIPVNGKPVIGWILDDLLKKQIDDVIIVLREQDWRLRDFLSWAYMGRMQLILAPLTTEGTILQSLLVGLQQSTSFEGLVRIILGDTLILDSYESLEDFVYIQEVEDPRRWCLITLDQDEYVSGYVDKQDIVLEKTLALVGYYHLQDKAYLQSCVERCINDGARELSDALRLYGVYHPIQATLVKEWYDFGHIDTLVKSQQRLLEPRYFNSLRIDSTLGTITKTSTNNQKLRDELDWYLNLPENLKALTPRIIRYYEEDGCLHLIQEYYGYPTLAELYVYTSLHIDVWTSILRQLLKVHQTFSQYRGEGQPSAIIEMYSTKTWERINMLVQQNPYWLELSDQATIILNGHTLRNIFVLKDQIDQRVNDLAAMSDFSIVHGDFCFSNVLYDLSHQIVRLIDPRGSFGAKGIYGDPRYDIAKLRHSLSGRYDMIIADMFKLHERDFEFKTNIYNDNATVVAIAFDNMIEAIGYDLQEVRFIEALLFISMLPLHHGHLERQKMMYLRGLQLLNEVF